MGAPPYAVVGVVHAGKTDPSVLSVKGKVVVFDTPEIARNFIPRLGNGRITRWKDADTCYWLEIDPNGIGTAVVLTDYDVYDVPARMEIPIAGNKGIRLIHSESRLREWRHHIMWNYAFFPDPRDVDGVDDRSSVAAA